MYRGCGPRNINSQHAEKASRLGHIESRETQNLEAKHSRGNGLEPMPRLPTSIAKPINVAEFLEALYKSWDFTSKSYLRQDGKRYAKLGLAVSGGVDSMALAGLCAQAREFQAKVPGSVELSYQPLIVDHKLRVGSTSEAKLVSERIQNLMGVTPLVLPVQWPYGAPPSGTSHVETAARTLRFQLLGRACRSRGIDSLLFAHHEDDIAETVLMRLISGASTTGLHLLKRAADIPECHGIHGVSQSTAAPSQTAGSLSKDSVHHGQGPGSQSPVWKRLVEVTLPLETGGITVHRPLLSFPKSRLQATCQDLGIDWVEDETNFDAGFTARNTVRQLLRSDRLPTTLRKPSLLALVHAATRTAEDQEARGRQLFNECKIIILDTGAGTLAIQFPSKASLYNANSAECLDRISAGHLLRQILYIVSPYENIPLRSLDLSIEAIFPHVLRREHMPQDAEETSDTWRDKISASPLNLSVAGVQVTKTALSRSPPIYILQRMCFGRLRFPVAIAIHPRLGSSLVSDSWPQTHLWDGRFWIKVENRTSQTLYIAPLTQPRIKAFGISLRKPGNPYKHTSESLRLEKVMKGLMQPNVRWTLPAIIRPVEMARTGYSGAEKKEDDENGSGVGDGSISAYKASQGNFSEESTLMNRLKAKEGAYTTRAEVEALGEVIALPTLGFVSRAWKSQISWNSKFKKVDLGAREVIVANSWHAQRVLKKEEASSKPGGTPITRSLRAIKIWHAHHHISSPSAPKYFSTGKQLAPTAQVTPKEMTGEREENALKRSSEANNSPNLKLDGTSIGPRNEVRETETDTNGGFEGLNQISSTQPRSPEGRSMETVFGVKGLANGISIAEALKATADKQVADLSNQRNGGTRSLLARKMKAKEVDGRKSSFEPNQAPERVTRSSNMARSPTVKVFRKVVAITKSDEERGTIRPVDRGPLITKHPSMRFLVRRKVVRETPVRSEFKPVEDHFSIESSTEPCDEEQAMLEMMTRADSEEEDWRFKAPWKHEATGPIEEVETKRAGETEEASQKEVEESRQTKVEVTPLHLQREAPAYVKQASDRIVAGRERVEGGGEGQGREAKGVLRAAGGGRMKEEEEEEEACRNASES